MERGNCDKEKGREKRMRKLGSTKTMTRERRELNQWRGREEREAGDFGRTGGSASPSSYLQSQEVCFF